MKTLTTSESKELYTKLYQQIHEAKKPKKGDMVTWNKKGGREFAVVALDKGNIAWIADDDGEEYEASITDLNIVKEEHLTEADFYRLPGNVIGNELYSLNREMDTFYRRMADGNDFDMDVFNAFIREMQKIKKEAKRFKSAQEVPVKYQYKS